MNAFGRHNNKLVIQSMKPSQKIFRCFYHKIIQSDWVGIEYIQRKRKKELHVEFLSARLKRVLGFFIRNNRTNVRIYACIFIQSENLVQTGGVNKSMIQRESGKEEEHILNAHVINLE